MTRPTWNQKLEALLTNPGNARWLGLAQNVLGDVKPGSRLNRHIYVECMALYLRVSSGAPLTDAVILPVKRFIEHMAAQPDRVLFDNPNVYPEPSGLYLIKRLPRFFNDVEASSGQMALFTRGVVAADAASVRLLDRLGENCGLLQQQSTGRFLKNTETYYSAFLRSCRDGLMDHNWNPDNKKRLHPIWDLYHFKGVSGTPTEQHDEEQTLAKLAAILPASFETLVSFPYANATTGKEFTQKMLETMASMSMSDCHASTRSGLLGNWCNDKNAGWLAVCQRYPDFGLAVDLHEGLVGNMAHLNARPLMQSLWQEYVVDKQVPAAFLALPADFSNISMTP